MPAKVPFTVHASEPVTIEVVARDGKTYLARVALALFEVTERDRPNPSTGLPEFDFRANIAVDVRPRD